MGNIDEFIDLVVKARENEAIKQTEAVREGMNTVFGQEIGALSYLTYSALEIRASGPKVIEVESLKSVSIYSCCSEDHPLIERFWRVFEAFTPEERSLYLKFVWGRNRLPVDLKSLS